MTAAESGPAPLLKIPDVAGLSLKHAALAYAQAGMHVVPTRTGDVKNPGSVVGSGWNKQASCDPAQIEKWWTEESRIGGIAFHPGPSGAVVFDLDRDEKPDDMPSAIWDALHTGVIQGTRKTGERAHYIFACDPDEFSCSAGGFMRWGQVRSRGGVVILAPTPHPDADTGQYRWRATGELPTLPDVLREMLSAPGQDAEPKTPEELKVFFGKHTDNNEPRGLQGLLTKFDADTKDGGSRHDAMRDALPWAFRESRLGRFSAQIAYDSLKHAFYRVKPEAMATGEFARLAQWAAAQAELADLDELRAKVDRPKDQAGEPDEFETAVSKELRWLEVRTEAKRRFAATSRAPLSRTVTNLTAFLAQPPNPTPMRIASLMPDGGRVVFSAPYKAGKTTAIGNLIRSLADGDPFLGTFPVHKRAKRVVLIDNELSQDMVRDWLLRQGIRNTDAVADVICLRGEISSFDIMDDVRRGQWAAHLRDIGCDYLIFDCLRPVLDALGLDENHDAGRFLTAFDELLAEAQTCGDATIVHHMGHASERARGDSRIQDWPDAIWKLLREKPDDDFSARYFSATGRDVDVPQGLVTYDPATRHLTYDGANRAQAQQQRRADETHQEIRRLLTEDKANGGTGLSRNQIEVEAIKKPNVTRQSVRESLEISSAIGDLATWNGARNAKMYAIARNDD